MKTLRVELGERSYPVCIGRGALLRAAELIGEVTEAKRLAVITDETVGERYGYALRHLLEEGGYEVLIATVPAGESSKSLAAVERLCRELARQGVNRGDAVAAFGGGVIGDLAGFVAAVYLRGVDLIQIPTTLLAQADSAVGGKTAVDLPEGKNLIGAIYQPRLVLSDTNLLDTLPEREIRCGMTEIIKCALIGDAEMLALLENCEPARLPRESILYRCCAMKAALVAADERDTGARMLLNFGHTLGHVYERAYGYGTYSHGEAVAAGMMKMLQLEGRETEALRGRLGALLTRYGLPTEIPCLPETVEAALGADKKNRGETLRVVELYAVGEPRIRTTTRAELIEKLEALEEK